MSAKHYLRPCLLSFLLASLLSFGFDLTVVEAEQVSFNRDIRPLLSDRCYFCHGFDEKNRQADLRLDQEEASRTVIFPGDPNNSELLRRISSQEEYEVMPPVDSHKVPLTKAEIAVFRLWIEQGAKYEPHWAFVKPERPEVRSPAKTELGPIDCFVAGQHAVNNLSFAKAAAPAKWLRRVSLDLTGIPPTTSEMVAFETAVSERGEVAYVEAVDRILAMPQYGERMALDWLDVARYADTNGYQADAFRMNWPWRDWVIEAFNMNMPFDQFTVEQLAGDLLEEPTTQQMIATAFNRNHMINGEGGSIKAENLAKTMFDRIATTGTAWLGLTIGCSQCHDHKFDPVSQKEYYQLYAFFNQTDETAYVDKQFDATPPGKKRGIKYMVDRPYISLATEEQRQELKELGARVEEAKAELEAQRPEFEPLFVEWIMEMREDPSLIEKRVTNGYFRRFVNTLALDQPENGNTKALTRMFLEESEEWRHLVTAVLEAEAAYSQKESLIPLVMVMRDNRKHDTYILDRGNYETPTEKVTADVPSFLPPLSEDVNKDRLALAKWLVSEQHPLTARVTVNRFWQLLFGRGLVATPDDFGLQGDLPTHPELLDWLAVEFRESGWDVKAMVKRIVLSRTYRQSAEVDAEKIAADPDNRWLARGPRRRLDSRLLRDQALALSGLLVREIGGPSVFPYQPPGVWEAISLGKNHYEQDHGDALYRRSLYTVWRRVIAPTNFFDVPSRQLCSVRAQLTSTPLHALTILNDTTYLEAARVWATELEELSDDEARLQEAFFAATARRLEPKEQDLLKKVLADSRKRFSEDLEGAANFVGVGESEVASHMKPDEHAAWMTVCLLILNLDETLSK